MRNQNSELKNVKRFGIPALILIVGLIITAMTAGINDAGQRTVVQYPSGHLLVKFSPGIYLSWFGSTETYNDVITYDFDKNEAEGEHATLDQKGIAVRYQDGGTGTIYGKSRYSLPMDEPTMLKLHKAFRSNAGVANKLIKAVTEEGQNLTAGLMTSEEAYATKRGIFTQWSQSQITDGKFQTFLEDVVQTDEVTGKQITKVVPMPLLDETTNLPLHFASDFKEYGISVSGYQITDWDFEPKTLKQIDTKRTATMGVITAKANAELAKQKAITAEEEGKALVMTAKYLEEVEKEKAVVVAERKKEVAVINAEQKVDVAKQGKLEAEQKKYAAKEFKAEQILIGQGEAERKRLVMKADGALDKKLATYERVNAKYATEFGKQKWVAEIQMGVGGKNSGGNAAQDLISMLAIKTAKDLKLDMSMKAGKK